MNRYTKPIPFSRPSIGYREMAAVRRVLRGGWLTSGPESQAFEKEFSQFLSSRKKEKIHTVSLNSATAGLHLALEALGIGKGDKVAVPTVTFTATAEVVRYLGADPIFIDCNPETGNISSSALAAVSKQIRAVIPVHMAGRPCNMSKIKEALGANEVFIVEDAAHAFPSETDRGMAGTIGDAGVYSFYATKTITTGEGGMLVSRNPAIAERARLMRLHGIDRAAWNRYSAGAPPRSWKYDVLAPGYKYNMTDVAAAIGRVQLRRASELFVQRKALAERYRRELSGIDSIGLPSETKGHAWHLYIIRLRSESLRDKLEAELLKKNIGSSVHFIPLHRMTYWKKMYNLNPRNFPHAESLADRILSIPLWPGMKKIEQNRIIETIQRVVHE